MILDLIKVTSGQHKKQTYISLVNVNKSAENCGSFHIYRRNPHWDSSSLCTERNKAMRKPLNLFICCSWWRWASLLRWVWFFTTQNYLKIVRSWPVVFVDKVTLKLSGPGESNHLPSYKKCRNVWKANGIELKFYGFS